MQVLRNILLTPADPNLAGKIQSNSDILVLLDTTNGAFSSILPDARQADNVELKLKHIANSSNNASISPGVSGQFIDTIYGTITVSKFCCKCLRSANGGWWIV